MIGEVAAATPTVGPATSVQVVADRFVHEPSLEAMAVVTGGRPVGLVTRTKLLSTVFRQFGWELYARKPITSVIIRNPLVIAAGQRLDTALAAALARPQEDVYDEIVVVDDGGSYTGLLSVLQMVLRQSHAVTTILVQKELAHERAREVEEVSRIKSQFLANVTHELRSPVNAIIELAELMRMAADRDQMGDLRSRLVLMAQSATNLRSVITNMLDLSKIESGKMRVIAEPFDLGAMMGEVGETTRVLIGSKPIEVIVSVENAPVTVDSDPVKLRQILLNLASNAAKFTDEGRIVLQQTSHNGTVTISVTDTGIGIREEDLPRLFTAFTQLEDAHSKQHGGTGLGLTITRELTHLLGGSVEIQSEYGRGTAFTVQIPRTIKGEEEP